MKKVLIVIPNLGVGGAETLVVNMCRYFDPLQFDVKLVSLYPNQGSVNDKRAEQWDVPVIYLHKKEGFDFGTIAELKKLFSIEKPDVISTHLGAILYVGLSLRNAKKLHTIHHIPDPSKNLNSYRRQLFVFKMLFKIGRFTPIAVCDEAVPAISKTYGIPETAIPCIYNGIELKRYQHLKRDDDLIQIINVGSLSYVKNHSALIRAVAEVHDRYDNVRLTILGEGEKRPELESLIQELNLGGVVSLAGCVDDVAGFLSRADLYVSTSISEANPLSVLEAMASQLPVIATDVGGMHNIITDGENGFLVPLSDSRLLGERIVKLCIEADQRERMGLNSKKRSEVYDIQVCVKQYEKLFNA